MARWRTAPQGADGLVLVRLEHVHVVHVRLPVLDEAVVVRGREPLVGVRPLQSADRRVMSLNQKVTTLGVALGPPEEWFRS